MTWMGGGIVGEDNDEGARLRTTGIEPDQFAERTDSSVTVICLLLAACYTRRYIHGLVASC